MHEHVLAPTWTESATPGIELNEIKSRTARSAAAASPCPITVLRVAQRGSAQRRGSMQPQRGMQLARA